MLWDDLHQAKILIVDDDPANIGLLKDVMKFGGFCNVQATDDPRGVIALFVEFEPDLVILDLNMPHISGFELLKMMQPLIDENDYLPILVVTAEHSYDSRRRALTGGASDLMTKPFLPDEVLVRITNMLRLRSRTVKLQEQLRKHTNELERYQMDLKEAQLETILRLARAAEHRDDETGKHTQRVGLLCALLAEKMDWEPHEIQLLHFAAPLHDVGKIGIPDSILLKPGRFT
ncbi:MAG TPA: response regulator, partial [Abditibacteriaceae bacterium]